MCRSQEVECLYANGSFPFAFYHLVVRGIRKLCEVYVHGWNAGYNQIIIALGDVYKTTFTTPWRIFVWVVMPFGLCNASATFQRLVLYIFTNLLFKSMTISIDDLNTLSSTSHHLECVKEALIRCRKMQLVLNPD